MTEWRFYGRQREQAQIHRILSTGRWFFCAVSGRRRIGKTALLQNVLKSHAPDRFLYFQIPDADERGVAQMFRDTFEDLRGPDPVIDKIRTFADIADLLGQAMDKGWIIVLDEFQYIHRESLSPFASYLQAIIDARRDGQRGGLFVLGSIHTEMTAILEEKTSPLFNRVTHRIDLGHWDFATLLEMMEAHGIVDPRHWLFLWSIFEGVPKFYRDVFEQGVLRPAIDYRAQTLRSLFFEGPSPLRDEADNWFLRELRGRYDIVLKLLASHGPMAHGDLVAAYDGEGGSHQLGPYLAALTDRYRMVERRLPIFAGDRSRKARYAIADNFLAAWLAGIARGVRMSRIRPVEQGVARSDTLLENHEGPSFEKLVRQVMEECSAKGVGDFALTEMVRGYWNKADGSDIEIDIVAIDEDSRRVRFGSCKRTAARHDGISLQQMHDQVDRFLITKEGRRFTGWKVERVAYAPCFTAGQRLAVSAKGMSCCDLDDFAIWLHPPS